jgi:3'-phosphoadenosine 5'-phosphosulfate sulfotransferase (PAPS reductase)/FAD synthetase
LKIDVCRRAINGQARFINARTLLVSGERAAESSARAKYAEFEADACDTREAKEVRRHVDRWRPVHAWDERDVWAIIKRWRVNPHPCYLLGFGRASCMKCIFGNADQWATVQAIDPLGFQQVADYEAAFGVTIKRKTSLPVLAAAGSPYPYAVEHAAMALADTYDHPIIVDRWRLPLGAFGDSQGPT